MTQILISVSPPYGLTELVLTVHKGGMMVVTPMKHVQPLVATQEVTSQMEIVILTIVTLRRLVHAHLAALVQRRDTMVLGTVLNPGRPVLPPTTQRMIAQEKL